MVIWVDKNKEQGWDTSKLCLFVYNSFYTVTHLFFFLWAVSDSWPLSSSPLEDEHDESSESLELEVEPLELSDATPVLVLKSTELATATKAGSFSYKKENMSFETPSK